MRESATIITRSEIPDITGLPVFNPYPGLRPFGPDEADLFFGRETHVEELMEKLTINRFVAVVGTSGSGKSSLVLAGILPRLHGGFRTEFGYFWRVAKMRPGGDPIGNLAKALIDAGVVDDQRSTFEKNKKEDDSIKVHLTRSGLKRSQLGLIRTVGDIRLDERENLLLVVDQFEELFRFRKISRGAQTDSATAFVNLLLEAVNQSKVPIYVLITMRSDFLGECTQFQGLPEAINQGQYLIPLLSRRQRQAAIEGPIHVAGATFSSTLLQQLLNDAGDMTDQLPVMQHALMRTFDAWKRRNKLDDPISLQDYRKAGGTEYALATHADEACRELDEEQTRVAQVMFRCLTDSSSDGRGVRRPCRALEILDVAATNLETLQQVVTCFTKESRSFLVLMPQSGPIRPETVIDLSHESLMRLWKQLQEWSESEVKSSEHLKIIADAARRHANGKAGLWSDPELALALKWQDEEKPNEKWAKRYNIKYDDIRRFLEESQRVRDLQASELERDRQQRLDQARALAEAERENAESLKRNSVVLRRWMVAVILLMLLSTIAAIWAFYQQRAAETAEAEALTLKEHAEEEKRAADNARKIAEQSQQQKNASLLIAMDEKEKAMREQEKAAKAKLAAEQERDRSEEAKLIAERNRREALKQKRQALAAKKRAMDMEKEKQAIERQRIEEIEEEKRILELKEKIPEWEDKKGN